jgi:dipeptidyl aminopeptidase/acylaminoacyl peptidase
MSPYRAIPALWRPTILLLCAGLCVGGLWLGYGYGSPSSDSGPGARRNPPLDRLCNDKEDGPPLPPVLFPSPRDPWQEATALAASYRMEEGHVANAAVQAARGEQPEESKPDAARTPGNVQSLDMAKAYERAKRLANDTRDKVFKASVTPHWFLNNTRFWYRNELRGGAKEFIVVDAEKGTRAPAFDHARLAAALSKAAEAEYRPQRLPFDAIAFADGGERVLFRAGGVNWQCDLTTYQCSRAVPELEEEASGAKDAESDLENGFADENTEATVEAADEDLAPQQKRKFGKGKFTPGAVPSAVREARSPDGAWTALVKDYNVYLRDKDGKENALTTNGAAGNAFSALTWAPDSRAVVAYRTEPGDDKQVYLIDSSPRDQLPAKFSQRPYPRPGDKFPLHEMWLLPVPARSATKPPAANNEKANDAKDATPPDGLQAKAAAIKVDVERIDYGRPPRLRWSKDGKRFTFEKTDRGHQRFRLIDVEAATGKTRNLIDEVSDTFIWTVHAPSTGLMDAHVTYLDKTDELVYVSQRDGWKHVYLLDAKTGAVKNRITQGPWVVRAIDRIDEDQRQIWFRASGKNPEQDPYFIHYYRVNFDGTGLVALTEGDGTHTVQYSPDRKHLIDTYSRVDMPPVHELRRVSDGKLVCKLEEADISALVATGWKAPEVHVAKGRDGVTDIWGIVVRPRNYDPNKKYPVIEQIYAGPHDSHVPKSFAAYRPLMALAELGFIVVQCDGMGTANRSRAFHDVCWKNLADAGFPDRILWIKALAKKYAYVDITRVGIYGTSAGGQSALGGLLFHPDFYKVAVSSCGCHDNRLDKASWNEQWMGLMGPHYEKQSNVTNAHQLQGKLLLIVGELDTNVPPESTLRVVDALIKADKDFDLLVMPGVGHSSGGAYGDRRRWDFFVWHLHGVAPPERNLARK